MALPLCTVLSEATHLDVGRGVAIVTLDARVRGPEGGCTVDAGSVIRAREEGRASPELVAFRASIDGKPAVIGGPRGRIAVDIPTTAASVRLVAVLRGDRFIAVPLASNPKIAGPTRFRAQTASVWGAERIAGTAAWVEVGAPVVVTPDPARDHEPASFTAVISRGTDGRGGAPALVVDGGPALGSEPVAVTEAARTAALARGGVDAITALLSDLPLSIATAPDPAAVLARMGETSRAARAAAISSDPLLSAIGQRLSTAIARGFQSCARPDTMSMPPRWPAPLRELVLTGVLDDGESGCPRLADLLTTNHPDVRFIQEGPAALGEAAVLSVDKLPAIGPITREIRPKVARPKRVTPRTVVLIAIALGTLVTALSLGLFASRRAR